MRKIHIYEDFFDLKEQDLLGSWKNILFKGLFLIILGIAIVFLPQILVALVASFFIFTGFIFVSTAYTLKKLKKGYQDVKVERLYEWF